MEIAKIVKTQELLNNYLGEEKVERINRDICKIIEENNLKHNPFLLK